MERKQHQPTEMNEMAEQISLILKYERTMSYEADKLQQFQIDDGFFLVASALSLVSEWNSMKFCK